jgi:hypothetical protein
MAKTFQARMKIQISHVWQRTYNLQRTEEHCYSQTNGHFAQLYIL